MTATLPRFLLLDIGGVMVRLNFRHLAERMKELSGVDAPRLQALLTADGLIARLETGNMSATEFSVEVCRRLGTDIPVRDLLGAWNSIFEEELLPDEILSGLSRKARLWVLSNTNELHFDYLAHHYTFLRHFEGFILSYQAGALKPDERVFRYALERMGAEAADVLFVDDQQENVDAARRLGIEAFRFLDPARFLEEMSLRGLL